MKDAQQRLAEATTKEDAPMAAAEAAEAQAAAKAAEAAEARAAAAAGTIALEVATLAATRAQHAATKADDARQKVDVVTNRKEKAAAKVADLKEKLNNKKKDIFDKNLDIIINEIYFKPKSTIFIRGHPYIIKSSKSSRIPRDSAAEVINENPVANTYSILLLEDKYVREETEHYVKDAVNAGILDKNKTEGKIEIQKTRTRLEEEAKKNGDRFKAYVQTLVDELNKYFKDRNIVYEYSPINGIQIKKGLTKAEKDQYENERHITKETITVVLVVSKKTSKFGEIRKNCKSKKLDIFNDIYNAIYNSNLEQLNNEEFLIFVKKHLSARAKPQQLGDLKDLSKKKGDKTTTSKKGGKYKTTSKKGGKYKKKIKRKYRTRKRYY